jgi:DNA-binding protein HU-beta
MTKAFIAEVLRESCELTHAGATAAAGDLINAIVEKLKRDGKFNLPGFGTFTVAKTKAHIGMNPRTGEKIKVKAGKTVRFKASPVLRRTVTASRQRRSVGDPATRSRRQSNHELPGEQLSAAAD